MRHAPSAVNSTRRRKWRLILLTCLLLAIPVVGCVLWIQRGGRAVEAELARIRAAGEPASAADLEAFYADPPANKDTTQLWLTAVAPLKSPGFVQASKPLPLVGESDSELPLPGQPWPELDATKALFAQYAESLDLLHEAAAMQGQARFAADFHAGASMLLQHIDGLRQGCRVLMLEAYVHAHQNDPHAAAESLWAAFELGHALDHEPIAISQLVGMACRGAPLEHLRRLMPVVEFSPEDIARLREQLRREESQLPIQRGLLGDRVLGIEAFQNPQTVGGMGMNPAWQLFRAHDFRRFLDYTRDLIDASRLPPGDAYQAVMRVEDELKAEIGQASNWQRSTKYLFTGMLAGNHQAVFKADSRIRAQSRSADAALAAVLFRRQHGRWPDSLSELAPSLLPMLPVDPFDAQPLRYKLTEVGPVFYSVGPDGRDDGGRDEEGQHDPDIVYALEAAPKK